MLSRVLIVSIHLLIIFASIEARALNNGTLGQKDFKQYYGAISPLGEWNEQQAKWMFYDQFIFDEIHDPVGFQVRSLQKFLEGDVASSVKCPIDTYHEHYHYIQYTYRLIMISLLAESIRRSQKLSLLSPKHGQCAVDWKALLKQCTPQTVNMQNFIQYASFVTSNWKNKKLKVGEKKSELLASFYKGKGDYPSKRYAYLCQQGDLECSDKVESTNNLCAKDKQTLIQLCSEKDSYYGVFNRKELYSLLARSHLIRNFVNPEQATGCLKKYSIQNHNRSKHDSMAFSAFPYTIWSLQNENVAYLEGELFPYGSLQEFESKGVAKVFEQVTLDKKSVVKQKVEKVVKKAATTKVISKVDLNKIEKVITAKKKQKKKIKRKYSAFWKSKLFLDKYELERVEVDMLELSMDYLFNSKQVGNLEKVAYKYFNRKALQKMKEEDLMGEKSAPIPLTFVKYLIDTQDHQKLFNIIDIVGNNFYVMNDLDKGLGKENIVPIQLEHNRQFQFNWKVSILNKF
jgi:hypothetical protein